ncbi:hypothetical protein MMA231_03497 (plasmid) [Asticcacaulis sp. MM231]|jgi:hypothetical protein|uniref:hypothetical protein n=1 Tax=Asticcacaulis sp. MM231 TaxID=3157666 RepID=UPI0032D59D71
MTFSFSVAINRFFKLLSENFPLIFLLGLLSYVLPDLALSFIGNIYAGIDDAYNNVFTSITSSWVGLVVGLLSVFLYLINISMVTEVAILRAVGKKPRISQIIASALHNALPILAISILSALWIGLGFIALIIPGIILSLGLSVVIPCYVGERHLGVIGALKRSLFLTRYHRGSIFLIALVSGILVAILTGMVAGSMRMSLLPDTILTPLTTAASDIMGVFGNVLYAAIYVTLRESKDKRGPEQTASVFE